MSDQNISIFTDGGARGNPGPAAFAFIVKNSAGKTVAEHSAYIGHTTNNIAEYSAVLSALNWLAETKIPLPPPPAGVNFYCDSLLVVNQLIGRYRIKNSNLREMVLKIKEAERKIASPVTYHHISREKNYQADCLLNQELDSCLSLAGK